MTTLFDLPGDIWTHVRPNLKKFDLWLLSRSSRQAKNLIKSLKYPLRLDSNMLATVWYYREEVLCYGLRHLPNIISTLDNTFLELSPVEQAVCFGGSLALVQRMLKQSVNPLYRFLVRYYLLLAKRLEDEIIIAESDAGPTLFICQRWNSHFEEINGGDLLNLLRGNSIDERISPFLTAFGPLYLGMGLKLDLGRAAGSDKFIASTIRWNSWGGFSSINEPAESSSKDIRDALAIALSIRGPQGRTWAPVSYQYFFAHRCYSCMTSQAVKWYAYTLNPVPAPAIMLSYRALGATTFERGVRWLLDTYGIQKLTSEIERWLEHCNPLAGMKSLPLACRKQAFLQALKLMEWTKIKITDGVLKKILQWATCGQLSTILSRPRISLCLTSKSIEWILTYSTDAQLRVLRQSLPSLVSQLYETAGPGRMIYFDLESLKHLKLVIPSAQGADTVITDNSVHICRKLLTFWRDNAQHRFTFEIRVKRTAQWSKSLVQKAIEADFPYLKFKEEGVTVCVNRVRGAILRLPTTTLNPQTLSGLLWFYAKEAWNPANVEVYGDADEAIQEFPGYRLIDLLL